MKMIIRIDILMQTLLIGGYAVFIYINGFGDKTLLAGTILMNWQLMSCLIMMIFSLKRRMEYVVFAVTAIAFQVILNVMSIVEPGWNPLIPAGLLPVLVTYYYLLTLIFPFRGDSHKGKFLPHTSF